MASSGQEKAWSKSREKPREEPEPIDVRAALRELGKTLEAVKDCKWALRSPCYCLPCLATDSQCPKGRAVRSMTASVFSLTRSINRA